MQTVVETPSYLRAAEAIFTDAERSEIVSRIAADPESGDLIQGTGGFRKLRAGRSGMGRRGGARVIYIYRNRIFPLFLVALRQESEGQPDEEGAERPHKTCR